MPGADGAFDLSPLATPAQLNAAIKRLTSSLTFKLTIPGTHYSGLTNEAILAIRAKEGRPFGANSLSLRRHVATYLRLVLEGATRVPRVSEIEALQRAAILEWIVQRIDGKVRDVRIRALTRDYQRAKLRKGYDGPPGVRTGAWRDAVASTGAVTLDV